MPRHKREPMFVRHPPIINHPPEAWHHQVPWPYRFKPDGGWLAILFLAAGGLVYKPLLLLAGFIAVLRCWIWICFRFPMTATFIFGFMQGLLGGRRTRRW
jgi:hypothetical protein